MAQVSDWVAFGLPLSELNRILVVLAREQAIQRVVLFGSRAKGNFRDGSDIDLCLEAPGLASAQMSRVVNALDDLLLPWKTDLVLHYEIQYPALIDHIQRVGIPLTAGAASHRVMRCAAENHRGECCAKATKR